MKLYLTPIFLLTLFLSCQKEPKKYASNIEVAHQKTAFISKEAVSFDIILKFGGNERLNGKITLLTNSGKGLIELNNGHKIYYNQDKVFYSPEIENTKSIRFDAYTWSYFFLFPYKLSDEGTVWNDYPYKKLNGKDYLTQKLSFAAGTGDAPDDWYITYANPKTNLLEIAAYIVTANKTLEEAESDPHAIQYSDYKIIDGVPIAHHWTFWGWNAEKGLTNQLGESTLNNIVFLTPDSALFIPPSNYLEIN